MPTSWFVRGGGKVYGPLDSAKLKQLVSAAKIDQTTEVAQTENGPWVPAGRVKGLFVQPPIAPSPAPAPRPSVPVAPPADPSPVVISSPAPIVASRPAVKRGGSYVDANLLPNEQVVYRAHLHWFYFLRPVFWFGFAFLMFRTGAGMKAGEQDASVTLITIGVLAVMAGIVSALMRAITYWTSEFAVTNRRVIMKQGFIRRKTMELMLGKVDSLSVDQGILGRIFGYGTVRVTVATEKQGFSFLSNPLEFRRQVQLHAPT